MPKTQVNNSVSFYYVTSKICCVTSVYISGYFGRSLNYNVVLGLIG